MERGQKLINSSPIGGEERSWFSSEPRPFVFEMISDAGMAVLDPLKNNGLKEFLLEAINLR